MSAIVFRPFWEVPSSITRRELLPQLRRNPHYHVVQVVPYGIEIPPKGQGSYVIWQYQASTKQTGYTPNR